MKLITILLSLFGFSICNAQISLPQKKLSSIEQLPSKVFEIEFPGFNNDSLIQHINLNLGKTNAFAIALDADIDLKSTGTYESLSNGDWVWRTKISSPTAFGYKIACDSFFLPEGVSLFFYSPQHNRIYGAYTSLNNNKKFNFATGVMYGQELIMEINAPKHLLDKISFHISRISYIYQPYNSDDFGGALDCHYNVKCLPWANDWCNEIRSTVKFEYLGIDNVWYRCSGVLINNPSQNFDPLILTAAHCGQIFTPEGVPGMDPHEWIVYYNFQSPECSPGSVGNDEMRSVGIDTLGYVQLFSCPDIGLLRVTEPMFWNYNLYFAGWNLVEKFSDLPSNDITVFHHPKGDVKKVTEAELYNPILPTGHSCWYANFTSGLLESGSSGAPLFDINHRVIGVVRGGEPEPDCETDKFNAGNLYTAAVTYLEDDRYYVSDAWDWQSLFGNGLVLDGIDPLGSCQPDIELRGNLYPGNDWQNKNEIIVQASNSIIVAPNNEPTIITTSPTYMWPNPTTPLHHSDYVFRAGNSITLKQGFIAQEGNQFRAELGSCLDFDGCGFNHASRLGNIQMKEPAGESHLSIFPNPAANRINIAFNEDFCCTLLSIEGKYLGKKDCSINQKASLYTESLPSGVYLLKIEGSKDVYFKKFVKQ